MRLGLGGVPVPTQIGFDGLEILDDGTFIATRGGFMAIDSTLWEISSVPDPASGLAEIALIPLTADPSITANLNGLALAPGGGGGGGALAVQVLCDNLAPERAQIVTCTGSASTMDPVQYSWVFRPDPVQIFPAGPPIVMADTVSAQGDSLWSGPMVVPGLIVVQGSNGSETGRDSIPISITDRSVQDAATWSTAMDSIIPELDAPWGLHPVEPFKILVGENVAFIIGTGVVSGTAFDTIPANPWENVTAGPNTGYRFLREPRFISLRLYRINQHVKNQGPKHDQDLSGNINPITQQPGGSYTNRHHYWVTKREGGQPNDLIEGIRAHETLGSTTGPGHQGRLVAAASDTAHCGDVNRIAERVAGTPALTQVAIDLLQGQSETYLEIESNHFYVTGVYSNVTVTAGDNLPDTVPYGGAHVFGFTSDSETDSLIPHSFLCNNP